MNLASEFFYEFRRFIPGVTAIVLYFRCEVRESLTKHPGWAIVSILVAAWLLGLIIEEVMSAVVQCAFAGLRWINVHKPPKPRPVWIRELKGATLWCQRMMRPRKTSGKSDPSESDDMQKLKARMSDLRFSERSMCRSLCGIFLFVSVWPFQPEALLTLAWQWGFGPVGVAAFGFAWVWPYVRKAWGEMSGKHGAIGLVIFVGLFIAYCIVFLLKLFYMLVSLVFAIAHAF